jgi:hypothetical protein
MEAVPEDVRGGVGASERRHRIATDGNLVHASAAAASPRVVETCKNSQIGKHR